MTVVVVDVDESLSVRLRRGDAKPCSYAVVHEGETVAAYETSADPRTAGGRVGLRNVICRRVPDRERTVVDERLSAAFDEHEAALAEEFGPR